ncbi:MAG: YybH family protein [Longimicrobiales bacterium]
MKCKRLGVPLLAALSACQGSAAVPTEQQSLTITASVDSATRAFESAQRALDPARVIAHLSPDFYMHVDGQRLSRDVVEENIRRDLGSVRQVEPGFQAIEVIVQSAKTAVASFRYHDSVIGADGALRRLRGATTLVWSRRGTDWLIVYAHADHHIDQGS